MFLSIAAVLLLSAAGSPRAQAGNPQSHAMAIPTNSRCPVTGNPVMPGKSLVVMVRGRDYLVCCPDCISKLQKHPDQYLGKDGAPKNAKAQGGHA